MTAGSIDLTVSAPPPRLAARAIDYARRHPTVIAGAAVLIVMALIALLAPWIAGDPMKISPIDRLKAPGDAHWFGTDFLGREVFARTIYGARVSLVVGGAVALVSVAIGLVIGLVAGYVRWIDAVVMRIMDGIMAIPGVLLAIALIAVAGASLINVVIAITIPEIPRVVRLVRSVVLSIREQPYVEAAVSVGSPLPKILFSWGNIMAEGRTYFQIAPWILFFPGLLLAVTVLAVNILGDGLRDSLDPRIARRM